MSSKTTISDCFYFLLLCCLFFFRSFSLIVFVLFANFSARWANSWLACRLTEVSLPLIKSEVDELPFPTLFWTFLPASLEQMRVRGNCWTERKRLKLVIRWGFCTWYLLLMYSKSLDFSQQRCYPIGRGWLSINVKKEQPKQPMIRSNRVSEMTSTSTLYLFVRACYCFGWWCA